MISYKAKKSLLYTELDQVKRKEYFDYNHRAFLHNIDTLYYVIKIAGDDLTVKGFDFFKCVLDELQVSAFSSSEALEVFTPECCDKYQINELENDYPWLMHGVAASKIYRYDLQQQDRFSMFIAANPPNQNTPEIIVQLRSQYLWLKGDKEAVIESLEEITNLLSVFKIKIKEVKENRIDYAYHTNYIQDPTSYFKHQNIGKMQQSRFTRGSIEFSFRNQFITETDYLTLGRKKSNNLFFRIYDKTKEVIQQQYKQFFIELWYQNKMISYFDKYCIEKAFLNPSADNFKYLDVARLEFYLEYGKDVSLKKEIDSLLGKKSKDYATIIELADKLTPPVTKILNVELETKRKFYSTLDDVINNLLTAENGPDYAAKLFRILDNKQLFHNFITRNTADGKGIIRFIDYKAKNRLGVGWKHKRDYPTSDFWKRLQSVSLDAINKDVKLIRQYQKNISMQLMKKRLINSVSTFSLYHHGQVKNDVFVDALDFISNLNETDLEKANAYKEKKFLLLKDRLTENETSLTKENDFGLVDLKTGELILGDSPVEESLDINNDTTIEYDESIVYTKDDVLTSFIYDLQREKLKLETMLAKVKDKYQKILLQRKLDKIVEKINYYK